MNINLKNTKLLANIKKIFNERDDVLTFVDDYSLMILEAKTKAAEEPEPQLLKVKYFLSDLARVTRVAKVSDHSNLEIFTPKQILQRLPITLGPVKASITYENLLNEIREIIYSM